MTFWSLTQPLDLYAAEPDDHARVRARLSDAAEGCSNVGSTEVCWVMHAVTGTVFGNSLKWRRRMPNTTFDGWTVEACGDSLPNTHWHLLRRGRLWLAWRVHKVVAGEHWLEVGPRARRERLRNAVALSPVAGSLLDLIDELTRQASGASGDRPNTYPYGELAAIELALGMRHPAGQEAQMLAALGGFPEARALAKSDFLYPEQSNRFPYRLRRRSV